jgi:hypothetical protein
MQTRFAYHKVGRQLVITETRLKILTMVARWFVFKPKIQIWVNFGGSWTGRGRYVLWTLGSFYGLLLYFMEI